MDVYDDGRVMLATATADQTVDHKMPYWSELHSYGINKTKALDDGWGLDQEPDQCGGTISLHDPREDHAATIR